MTSEDGDILVAEIVDQWRDEKIHIGTPLQPKHAAFGLAAVAVAVMFIALIMQNLVLTQLMTPKDPVEITSAYPYGSGQTGPISPMHHMVS